MARHKEFEPDMALEHAMTLFWERGYEHTSMQDLVTRMGVHKRSMYDTFGDKHALYLKALDRYTDRLEAAHRELTEQATDARSALRTLLEHSVDGATRDSRGCLMVNTATELGGRDEAAAKLVDQSFATSQQLLRDLIDRGRRAGDLDPGQDADRLAALVLNSWIGLRVQARAGASKQRLLALVDDILALLD